MFILKMSFAELESLIIIQVKTDSDRPFFKLRSSWRDSKMFFKLNLIRSTYWQAIVRSLWDPENIKKKIFNNKLISRSKVLINYKELFSNRHLLALKNYLFVNFKILFISKIEQLNW